MIATTPQAHDPNGGPSTADAVMACAAYKSDPEGSTSADRGKRIHEYVAAMLTGTTPPDVSDDEREEGDWVLTEVSPLSVVEVERKVTVYEADGITTATFGTADMIGKEWFGDIKTGRRRNHYYQMAAYADALMTEQGIPAITCYLFWSGLRYVEMITFTAAEAANAVKEWLNRRNGSGQPTPCDYCGWCAKRLGCPALQAQAREVVAGYAELDLPTYHASEVSDPATMGRLLNAANIIEKWADSVKHHATQLAKNGAEIPGYKLCERSGAFEIPNVDEALTQLSLQQDLDIAPCLSISVSKLADELATKRNISKPKAKTLLCELLAGLVEQKPSTQYLRKVG